jgi:Tol biopolymer transport system component/TolB-like protein/DNA-binding SARP family transcriptional activator
MIRLHLFGALELRRADGAELHSVLSQPKRAAVLAFLAASRGYARRDRLLGLLWPELDGARARNALSKALHHLRRSLGEESIIGRGDDELRTHPALFWCDVAAFGEALSQGDDAAAVGLYRGHFLEGFHLPEAPDYERWVDDERERLRRAATEAAGRLTETCADPREAIRWARRSHALSPTEEQPLRRLLTLLVQAGERAEAVSVYNSFVERLRTEYELEPAAETQALVAELQARGAAGPPASSPRPTPWTPAAEDERMDEAEGREAPQPRPRRRRVAGILVLGILILAGLTAWWPHRTRTEAAHAADGSVVVLPFMSLSGDGRDARFGEGLTEELITRLARLTDLRVLPRAHVGAVDGAGRLSAIAEELPATKVVRGTVRSDGDRVRIAVQLVDPATGAYLWAETYDRQRAGMLGAQAEIAHRIAIAVGLRLRSDSTRSTRGKSAAADPLTLRVILSTTGQDVDTSGYTLTVGDDRRAVAVDEIVEFNDVSIGEHTVVLGDVAPNCSPEATVQSTVVNSGDTTRIVFEVSCVTKRQLVFWRWLGDHRDVFVMNTDGTGLRNLTNDAAPELAPVWSPDGTQIAYISDGRLCLMNADGSNRRRLTDGPDNYPSWSPDGTRIAFSRGKRTADIHVIHIDGSGLVNLTRDDRAFNIEPAWSPDGSRIAFERGGDLYVMSEDGSDARLLTSDGSAPAWSPDGEKIAFHSRRTGNYEVFVMNADGSDVTRLTDDPALDTHPAWSPDGTRIAFGSDRSGHGSIYLMKPNGTGITLLADGAAGEAHQADWRR